MDKWPILSHLSPDFHQSLQLVYVFGSNAIMVTKDDDVYAIGKNINGCLGIGNNVATFERKVLKELCKKNIVGLSSGDPGNHILAHTTGGDLFSWGNNSHYQLGTSQNGGGYVDIPTAIGLRVTMVACGRAHTVALTLDGEILAWGANENYQCGTGSNSSNYYTPQKITANIGEERAVAIACCQYSSIALLENGKVIGWGRNQEGQLGLGHSNQVSQPCLVTGLKGVNITQIVCGASHVMVLSHKGVLFTWGHNSAGQLGNGNTTNQSTPIQVSLHSEREPKKEDSTLEENATEDWTKRIVEIAATHCNNTSSAMTEMGRVYMWGACYNASIIRPFETEFLDMHDVFARAVSCPKTWTPFKVDQSFCSLSETLRKSFDDSATSDLTFCVKGKPIHVHRAILTIRCEHLRAMFANQWKENCENTIEIEHYSYDVYRSFLEYLYTGRVDSPPDDIIELLDLANSYCEEELKIICKRIAKRIISVENCLMLYSAAIKFGETVLEDFCFGYAIHHLTEVSRTVDLTQLDDSILRKLFVRAGNEGAYRY